MVVACLTQWLCRRLIFRFAKYPYLEYVIIFSVGTFVQIIYIFFGNFLKLDEFSKFRGSMIILVPQHSDIIPNSIYLLSKFASRAFILFCTDCITNPIKASQIFCQIFWSEQSEILFLMDLRKFRYFHQSDEI